MHLAGQVVGSMFGMFGMGAARLMPHFGGYSLKFERVTPGALRVPASQFTFSSSREEYRMHSNLHDGKMLFMLGIDIHTQGVGGVGRPRP